jgi:hypothetical protein
MILLLKSTADIWMDRYAEYLSQEGISYLMLSIDDIIKHVEIIDSPSGVIWKLFGSSIDIQGFSGIYHRLQMLDDSFFSIYKDEDREYAREEWASYILYCFAKPDNVVNPINHKTFRQLQANFPMLSYIAKKENIKTPQYFFSAERCVLQQEAKKIGNYTAREGLYSYHAVGEKSEITEKTSMIIENIRGALLFVHVVGIKVFSSIYFKEGGKTFQLPRLIEKKILTLGKRLGFCCYEVVLRRTISEEYYLYSVSGVPEWSTCVHPMVKIWLELTNLLSSKKVRINKRASYISVAERPDVIGSSIKINQVTTE